MVRISWRELLRKLEGWEEGSGVATVPVSEKPSWRRQCVGVLENEAEFARGGGEDGAGKGTGSRYNGTEV